MSIFSLIICKSNLIYRVKLKSPLEGIWYIYIYMYVIILICLFKSFEELMVHFQPNTFLHININF